MGRRRFAWAALCAAVAVGTSCTYLLGLEGIEVGEVQDGGVDGGGAAGAGGAGNGGSGGAGTGGGAGGGGGSCTPGDLVVSNLTAPSAIAFATDRLFWVEQLSPASGRVRSAPAGNPAHDWEVTTQGKPSDITSDGTSVFWTAGSRLETASLSAQQVEGFWPGSGPLGVAMGEMFVVWTEFSANRVNQVALGSGGGGGAGGNSPIADATDGVANPQAVAVNGNYVYWLEPSNVSRVDLMSGTVEVRADGQVHSTYSGIAADSENVYWTTTDGFVRAIRHVAAMNAVTDLASNEGDLGGIAVDTTDVYWTSRNRKVIRAVPRAGGDPRTLADCQSDPVDVVAGGAVIYWVDAMQGQIRSAPK